MEENKVVRVFKSKAVEIQEIKAKIEKILVENNLSLVPVVVIVNDKVTSRIEIVEKTESK